MSHLPEGKCFLIVAKENICVGEDQVQLKQWQLVVGDPALFLFSDTDPELFLFHIWSQIPSVAAPDRYHFAGSKILNLIPKIPIQTLLVI